MKENKLDGWVAELNDIAASAKPEEREAMDAFMGAITPYLEQPEYLRTLLGKIKAGHVIGQDLTQSADFKSIDELKSYLNSDATLVEA